MSYTELDAWLDEKAQGNWPFERWDIGSPTLRNDFDYLDTLYNPGLSVISYRLRSAFGYRRTISELQAALVAAAETVNAAIEISEAEANASWLQHEVWLPILDESTNGSESPAEMLVDSLQVIILDDDFSAQEQCAALGLWLLGMWDDYRSKRDYRNQLLALTQASIALAEAECRQGYSNCEKEYRKELKKRNTAAADSRHTANRVRKLSAKQWFVENRDTFVNKAQAATKIAEKYSIVFDVAKRWVSEFYRLT